MGLKIMQIIVFTLGDKYYALNTDKVEEITTEMVSSSISKAPEWVEGLINLRGSLMPLVNLFKLLDHAGDLCYNNIIIVKQDEDHMGLMVSDVIKVVNIAEEDIQKSRDVKDGLLGIIIMDEEIINLIDIEKLLSSK